jgi:hypothetical protein
MLLFIAQTGANLDTAQQLQLDTMEILPSTQGRRFSGTKSRAGKDSTPEFGVKFEPVFRKFWNFENGIFKMKHVILSFHCATKFSNWDL